MRFNYWYIVVILLVFNSCSKSTTTNSSPHLIIQFLFDSTQTRLDNIGQKADMAAGNAGQSPSFKTLGVHYIELAPNKNTQIGKGAVLYMTEETSIGGANAIDFSKETMITSSSNSISIPLNKIAAGDYEYIRISLGYQGYDIIATADLSAWSMGKVDFPLTISSFVGFNSYITSHKIKDSTISINANKKQGYWAGEMHLNYGLAQSHQVLQGQNPSTTVTNPLFATSPNPNGSCLVTSDFSGSKLTIPTNGANDIKIQVSISINKSFEWKEQIINGKWDVYPNQEPVVDMGVRGMISKIIL